MQLANYRVTLSGQEYTPNIYKGSHNLIYLELNLDDSGCCDHAKLIFGGSGAFSANCEDPVEVELGDQEQKTVCFQGEVTRLSFCATHIIVEARKPEYRLFSLHFDQLFQNQSSGSIVKKILTKANVQPGQIEEGITFPYYPLSAKQNGYEHIRILAEKNDFLSFTDSKNRFVFSRPVQALSKRAFSYEKDILELTHHSGHPPYKKFIVYGESPSSVKGTNTAQWLHTKPAQYEGKKGTGNAWVENDYSLRNKQSAIQESQNLSARSERTKLEGKVRTIGASNVFPGDCISLSGCPLQTLNRTFLVRSVQHLYNCVDGYVSCFHFCTPK